jgi:hypothetical protein
MRDGSNSEGLRLIRDKPSPSFRWALARDDWYDLVALLDGMIAAKYPCHQYLTSFPSEDALVVVSKGEYDDSVLVGIDE